jgi:uncharacterized protein (TIGR02646 family)
MLQLGKRDLPVPIQSVLNELQSKVNQESGFAAKVAKAQNLWKSKGDRAGKKAFNVIAKELADMCVYVHVCNYCEQNEANDIEHVYPKSFFPSYTFDWKNYILACKQCNSAYKLDKCFVLDDDGTVYEVLRGHEPADQTVAMINPRTDDPLQYMWLNTQTWKFDIQDNLSLKDFNIAEKTLSILQLNERDLLIEDRKNTAVYYFERMKTLAEILEANSISDIENALSPYDNEIDKTLPLQEIKNQIKGSFKTHLNRFKHPSVWHSIKKIDSIATPKWKEIFDKIPEARTW